MDTTQVYMVRSAKGYDMLCVDNYLYHYEDRGVNSYRWVCNRRKDKTLPCRSRIITTLVDDDPTKHQVQKVVGDHTHGKCSAGEISKAFERKRMANLSGEGCTLEHKAEKRKIRRMEEFEQTIRRDIKGEDQDGDEAEVSPNWGENEDKYDDDDDEWADWLLNEEELPKKKQAAKLKQAAQAVKKDNSKSASLGAGSSSNPGFHFKEEQLYMLKTLYGRQIVCLDGFLYRLEGKSPTTGTYRWECVRRRTACKARLHTVPQPNGEHKAKQISGCADHVDAHRHGPYTPQQLRQLLLQNNITLISDQPKRKVGRPRKNPAGKFEEVTYSTDNSKMKSFSEIIEECGQDTKCEQEDVLETSDSSKKKSKRHTMPTRNVSSSKKNKTNKTMNYTYELVNDPLDALNDEEEDDSEPGVKKFTFLPSAKGNQVLCLDNFLYHFDSRSQSNGRSYWTCVLRRDKCYKCNGRITTQTTSNGPSIVKVSGEHKHPDSTPDIKRRLYKSVVAQKASETKMKPSEILNSTMTELGDEFKRIVAKSKETIERRIGRLRNKFKKEKTKSQEQDEQNDSSSSFASALESDDEHFEFANLPTKLEQMREPVSDALSQTGLECFETVETTMEEEYVASTYYSQEDNDYEQEEEEDTDELGEGASSRKRKWNIDITDIKPIFKHGRKRKGDVDNIEPDMDVSKVSKLRSAKGGELLCVDGYIYHMKSGQQNARTYWTCIKCKDRNINCKSRVATVNAKDGIKVFKVTNLHTHPVNEHDIKRRLYNELSKGIPNVSLKPYQVLEKSLNELSKEYADIIANSKGAKKWHTKDSTSKREPVGSDSVVVKQQPDEGEASTFNMSELYGNDSIDFRSVMKLYAVSDGPPSLAVRMTLKALKIPYELVNVDYIAAQHMTEEYAKMNPQKEIPVLDDNGFYLPESIAIMQYLCDKYAPMSDHLYPKDATQRAVVNHRLCFNMGFYYSSISAYAMAPIFFDYPRSEMGLKKVNNALSVFETYLQRAATKYAAADHLTIADFALVSATICLEAIGFDLSPFSLVKQWYETFKMEQPELWQIANGGMQEIAECERNPPDLSHMEHPFHPTKKTKA